MANVIDKNELFNLINALTVDSEFSNEDLIYLVNWLITNGEMTGAPRDMIQIRRGPFADLPTLAQGELAVTLDTNQLFVGGLTGNIDTLKPVKDILLNMQYDVTEYGLKGDYLLGDGSININATDNTELLQDLLDSLPAGAIVFFPLGSYKFTNTVYIRKPVSITGVGIGEHVATNLHFFLTESSTRDCAISIESVDSNNTRNISIENLHVLYEWETVGLSAQVHDGISTKHNTGYLVDYISSNVRLRRFRNPLYMPNIYLADFINVRATSGVNGFNFPGFSTALRFERCYSQHNVTGDGFIINNVVYSIFNSCAADDNQRAYYFTNCRGVTMSGSGAEGNRKTAIHFGGGNNGFTVTSFFSHQNGASSVSTDASYGISVHSDYTNRNINIESLNEESISDLAAGRSFSMFFGGRPDSINIETCNTQKTIGSDAAYLGSLSINGEYEGAGVPTFGYHRKGKIIWNRDNAGFANEPGWQCERTGHANNVTWTSNTAYAVNAEVNNGTYTYRATTGGTSGTTAIGSLPVSNNIVSDGTVIWLRLGNQATFGAVPSLYRSGSFTPTLMTDGGSGGSGNVYTTQSGNYIRYGKLVKVTFEVVVSTFDVAATGALYVGGLPFVVDDSDITLESSNVLSAIGGLTLADGVPITVSYPGYSRLRISKLSNTGAVQLNVSAVSGAVTIKGSHVYTMD